MDRVRDAMVVDPPMLGGSASAQEAGVALARPEVRALFICDDGRLLGVVTREQLEARLARDIAPDSLKSLVDGGFTHAHPDHPIDGVVERFGHSGELLPVVSRADVTRVMGVVRSTTSSNASAAKHCRSTARLADPASWALRYECRAAWRRRLRRSTFR